MNELDDVIEIKGIRGFGHHGVLEDERIRGQEFIVDVQLGVRTKKAAKFDDLDRTVDYSAAARTVYAHIVSEPRNLIETLAEDIARDLLNDERVKWVRVTVHKPQAPIAVDFLDVSITITRSR